jgi:hypothetical protein
MTYLPKHLLVNRQDLLHAKHKHTCHPDENDIGKRKEQGDDASTNKFRLFSVTPPLGNRAVLDIGIVQPKNSCIHRWLYESSKKVSPDYQIARIMRIPSVPGGRRDALTTCENQNVSFGNVIDMSYISCFHSVPDCYSHQRTRLIIE